ncbi:transglycosylase SLT domain-containing protein, partial [Vibrio breoganii]
MYLFKITTVAVALHLIVALPVWANDPFDELDKEVKRLNVDDEAAFEQWYAKQLNDFTQWQIANLEQWDKENQSSMSKWGDTSTASQDVIVVYDEKNHTRTVIDLNTEEITINYSGPLVNSVHSAEASATMVNQVIKSNEQLWGHLGFESPDQATAHTLNIEPISVPVQTLEDMEREIRAQTERQMSQLDIYADQTMVSENTAVRDTIIAQQKNTLKVNEAKRIEKVKLEVENQTTQHQLKLTQVAEYKAKIPSSALSERAQIYYPQIQRESTKRNLPPELVLAIMHTESHFNPKARSHIPAYGLMQIVPTSAGHDVNKLFRGHDAPMRPDDLYDPDINIETGAEYLKILDRRYLKGIKDPKSAAYCVIAAYNTGAGNVARAFGDRRVSVAVN